MANPPKPDPLARKRIIFATTQDPSVYKQYAGPGIVVAVMPGTTAAQVAAIKATGADVAYWDPEVTTQTIVAARNLGITTVIGQVEGPYQLDNYNAAYAAKDPNMTVGTVTSNGSAYYTPNADFMFVESYPGEVPNQTADRAYANAQSANPKMPVYVVIGGGGAASSATQQAKAAAKYGSYGIFASGPENKEEIRAMLAPPLGVKPQPGGAAAGATPAIASGGNQNPLTKRSKSLRHGRADETPIDKTPPAEQPLGIKGPHDEAGTVGAPPAYKGGAPIVDNPTNPDDTYSFTDKKNRRVTITTTTSGAKIEQVAGINPKTGEEYTPYQIKKPYEAPIDSTKPAWHQDPNWGTPDGGLASKAGLNSSQVLEQRPGANGNTVFRLSDGTYKSYNPNTGQTVGAGNWNNQEWEASQHGAVNVSSEAINNGSPAQTDASSSGPNYGMQATSPPSDVKIEDAGQGATDPTQVTGGQTSTSSPTNGNGIDPYFAAENPNSHFGGQSID